MAGSVKTGVAFADVLRHELARNEAASNCIEWFRKERQWINDLQLQLCRIPAPTFLEQKRAEWTAHRFRELGYDAKIDRAGNVIAKLESRNSPSMVALTAHLDTVLAPRSADEISVDPDGRMRGPGVSDNGAGLAALFAIARYCRQREDSLPVVFVANVGEEGEGNLSGMRYLCRQSPLATRIHSFLVLDGPATDHITTTALASRRFEVLFTGSGGHSWSDFGAGNPVHALGRVIAHFADTYSRDASELPRASFNFGIVGGGSSINSIPVEARTKVDLRSESSAKLDRLVEMLTASVERALQIENERANGSRVTAKLKELGSRPGGTLAPDAPILEALNTVDAHLGIRARLDCASTDANLPLSLGMHAVSIGAGGSGGGAHTPSEWFHPDGREKALQRILLTLILLARTS